MSHSTKHVRPLYDLLVSWQYPTLYEKAGGVVGDRQTHYSDEYTIRRAMPLLLRGSVPLALLTALGIVLVLLAILASLLYLQLPFWPPGQSTIRAAGGCADVDVEETPQQPGISREQAVEESRQQLEEAGIATSDRDDESLPYIGSVYWSRYGYWEPHGTVPRWIIIVENRYDEHWHYRNLLRNPEDRVTVVYIPGRREVAEFCVSLTQQRGGKRFNVWHPVQ